MAKGNSVTAKWDRTKGRPEPIRALNLIRELESGEPLVDIREVCPSVKLIRPQVIPYCRAQVAQKFEAAARSLPEGFYFGLVEAWRPIQRQQRIYDFLYASAKEAFPERDHTAIRRTICRFVAPTDQKAPPGHCTGAALDIWLVNEAGEELDVTSPFERFKASPTYTIGLTPAAQKNRDILVNAMLAQGFSNCRDEWWHYSYGDAGWAVRMGKTECEYGLIQLDPEIYKDNEVLWLEAFKERTNPFLKHD